MSTQSATARPAPGLGRQMLNKVPEVTLFFWIIKIMCTTVGETAADYLNVNLGFGLNNTTYVTAARPEHAEPLYERFCERLGARRGVFGARMAVELVNDGPVTLMLEVE